MAEFSKRPTPSPEEFIEGAIEHEQSEPAGEFPWGHLNPKIQKAFTLRTDEQTLAKINWVVDRTLGMRSVQQWLRKTITEALEREIAKLLGKN